ncbi:hypothetical protein RG963_11035 [Methanosarcina sp. Z-7115]|uniref:Uncharacterized protein n=1 Tax=Methanosarcina baikalica TaxID=3073890 RepID=A0ABU2D2U7_9EURY|nr:hypothetical protein [Methanosarcina sp. Z-7115]MDR7666303.1 hypothetical protein [Methanosarcina sp. Z-7115]
MKDYFVCTENASSSILIEIDVELLEFENIDDPLKDDFVCTESASSSILIEKDVELLQFTKTAESCSDICAAETSIKQRQTRYNKVQINSKVTSLDISLSWKYKKNSLRLTILSPTGVSYGSYIANSSNKIVLNIKPKTGKYLQGGNWKLNVYGVLISGTEAYKLKAAAHF